MEMVVSRFLYILCWRNKLVIILLILSASLGMLITLSYHSTKLSVNDEILRNGKGYVPINEHFKHWKGKASREVDKGQGDSRFTGPPTEQIKDKKRRIKIFDNSNKNGAEINLLPPIKTNGTRLKIFDKHEDWRAAPAVEKLSRGKSQRRHFYKDPASNVQANDHKEVQSNDAPVKVHVSSRESQVASDHAAEVLKDDGEKGELFKKTKVADQTDHKVIRRPDDKYHDGFIVHREVPANKADQISQKGSDRKKTFINKRLFNVNKQIVNELRKQVPAPADSSRNDQGAGKNRLLNDKDTQDTPDREPKINSQRSQNLAAGKKRQSDDGYGKPDVANVDIKLGGKGSHPRLGEIKQDQTAGKRKQTEEWQPRHDIMPQPGDKWKRVHELYQDLLQHKQGQDDLRRPWQQERPLEEVRRMNQNQAWWKEQQRGRRTHAKQQGEEKHQREEPKGEPKPQHVQQEGREQQNLVEQLQVHRQQLHQLQQEQSQLRDHLLSQNSHHGHSKGLSTTQLLQPLPGQAHKQDDSALGNANAKKSLQEDQFPQIKNTNRDESVGLFINKTNDHMNIIRMNLIQHIHRSNDFSPRHRKTYFHDKNSLPEMFTQWLSSGEALCDGKIMAYNSEFAHINELIIDRNFCHGRKGGEAMQDVFNQPEDDEYYTYYPGFFQMSCSKKPQYYFNNNNHLNQWLYSLNHKAENNLLYNEVRPQFTIALVRYEYANLYHTMTDFYNAFALMEMFNRSQTETNILLIDGHPAGALDPVWTVLFNSSTRVSALGTRTKFSNIVWSILGYNSPMMEHYAPSLPLVEEFRNFFLSSFRVADSHKLNCDRINILFIWRRDYIAHPRNPSGAISRKIQNEQELVDTLRKDFPAFAVKGIQIDLFEMRQQLEFVRDTDILIGMHGAGLTHTMFLPKHAGLIELLPTYWSAANEHFHAIAKWRRIRYRQWTNQDPENEAPNHFTKIPPEVLKDLVMTLVNVICGYTTDIPDDMAR